MRCLGFCASIDRARFTARHYTRCGIPAVAVLGDSPRDARSSVVTISLRSEYQLYDADGIIHFVVLPDPHDGPPGLGERCIDPTVALDVRSELWHPVLEVRLRDVLVVWATVPEAAIDEDGDLPTREDDIGAHSDGPDPQEVVLAEPMAAPVQR